MLLFTSSYCYYILLYILIAGVWFWLSRREVAYRGGMTYVTCTMVGSTPALLATATCTSRMVWANDGLVDTTLGSSAGSVIQTAGR